MAKLYLIPSPLADGTGATVIPPRSIGSIQSIRYFLAENERTARRYFSGLKIFESISELHFSTLDKDTTRETIAEQLKPLLEGYDMGVVSEAGCPGVADPGALAVEFAHEKNIQVVPLVGPSSVLLALMASGLEGQRFAFHGYIPVEEKEAVAAIRGLERESKERGQTQILIETPYRNQKMLERLIRHLQSSTRLCVAADLTGANERIESRTVAKWRSKQTELPKVPAIFLFLA